MNEITKEMLELNVVPDYIYDKIEEYKSAIDWMETFKYQLKKAMEENGINKFDTDYYLFNLIAEGETTKMDKDAMSNELVTYVDGDTGELKTMSALDYYERFKIKTPRASYLKMKEKK